MGRILAEAEEQERPLIDLGLKSCPCKRQSESQKENLRSETGHAAHQEDLGMTSYDAWQPGGAKGCDGDEGLGLITVCVTKKGYLYIFMNVICLCYPF